MLQPDLFELGEISRKAGAFTLGAALRIGEDQSEAREYGYVSDEFIGVHEAHFVRQIHPALVGCSDDRKPTKQSVEELAAAYPSETLRADEAYASVFGGAAGITKNMLVAYIAQHGTERATTLLNDVGGFESLLNLVVWKMGVEDNDQALKPLLHSAENNEEPDGTFCMHGDAATGCAYCGGVGATSFLLLDETKFEGDVTLADIATKDQLAMFGEMNHENVGRLLAAHQTFLDIATNGKGKDLTVDRQLFIEQISKGNPAMILSGTHAKVTATGLIHNFVLGDIGSASEANQDGAPFYRQDIAQVTAAIIRNFSGLELDPEVLMRAFLLDSTPVRSVLVNHDEEQYGNLDPRALATGARGNPWISIEQIRKT
ncbi:MAG TPA: hypothetical protein VGM08_00930 [Candidatus Saccharimonadales bacterium]